MSTTPIADAVEERCLEAVRLFMAMPELERAKQLPEFIGDITHELLTECRKIESKEYHAIIEARNAALEEAAKAVEPTCPPSPDSSWEKGYWGAQNTYAHAIRKMKSSRAERPVNDLPRRGPRHIIE